MKDKIKEDFAFYDEYHRHPINKLIHIVCIWNLLVFICFLNNIDYNIPLITNSSQEISPGFQNVFPLKLFYFIFGYIIYYLYLAPCLGGISALFYLIIYSSNLFVCNIDESWELQLFLLQVDLQININVLKEIVHVF